MSLKVLYVTQVICQKIQGGKGSGTFYLGNLGLFEVPQLHLNAVLFGDTDTSSNILFHLKMHLSVHQTAKPLQQNEHQETGDRWGLQGPALPHAKQVQSHHFSLNPSCPKDEMGWHFLTLKVTMEIQTNRSQCSV